VLQKFGRDLRGVDARSHEVVALVAKHFDTTSDDNSPLNVSQAPCAAVHTRKVVGNVRRRTERFGQAG
jgi:hypothetical protein